MKYLWFIISIALSLSSVTTKLYGQFYDDFSDGDLSRNPKWEGNLEHFIINQAYQLQLDAPAEGNSLLFTRYNTLDSMEWGFYFKMDFDPSNSNKMRIYLMADRIETADLSGYFLEIGENGNEDKIKFFRSDNGNNTLLGSGRPGAFAFAPATATIRITRSKNGDWKFYSQQGGQYFALEMELRDDKLMFADSWFIINCIYTSTRRDKFFFDDVYMEEFIPDDQAPQLIKASLADETSLELLFDEKIDESSIYNNSNYAISPENRNPVQILYDTLFPNKISLKYAVAFSGGVVYTVTVSGIEDLSGNVCEDESMKFYLIENPDIKDLVINELLFNPNSGSGPFVELINNSEKFINLRGLSVFSSSSGKKEVLMRDRIMKKGDIVCITDNAGSLAVDYFIPGSVEFYNNRLPSISRDRGDIVISRTDHVSGQITIDSFNYDKNMHSSFLNSDRGVSLERKNPSAETNDRFNWTSASTNSGGATPGYINSSYYELKSEKPGLVIKNRVFSPDFDGFNDELEIEYNLESEGYLLNIVIYDHKGRFIHHLINNETVGLRGLITWDGMAQGKQMPIGIYLMHYTLTGEDGKRETGKKPFVLAQKLR
jgi:hypothetical protein